MTYNPNESVRVKADGSIERNVEVLHRASNIRDGDARTSMVPGRVVHARRFAPGGIPSGVNQHLPCTTSRCETCAYIDNHVGAIR